MSEYAQTVLDKIVEQATFAYPEALVDDQIHHLLNHLGLRPASTRPDARRLYESRQQVARRLA